MKEIQLKAYGKVNIGLDVLRRMENGYHELKMIMQTVGIYDEITITKMPCNNGITIESNTGLIPTDENNLAYKAARLLMDEANIRDGVNIKIIKNIPIAAGMAGGSSDCAAVLRGINEVFGLNLSTDQLMERGVKLGADVPYCIIGGTALAAGIGERLTHLPSPPECYVLVAKPDISVSTKYVYENLHADKLKHHPDIDGIITAINENDLYGMASLMENVLETVTENKYGIITEIKNEMMKCGAIKSLMSGSGPTVFGLFDDEAVALDAYTRIKNKNMAAQIFLTTWAGTI
ncbi:MAG: 4-(cytidine 5'-diphospho)-2-C-methyl-D-erythritol kinase [Eubacterium sp.]